MNFGVLPQVKNRLIAHPRKHCVAGLSIVILALSILVPVNSAYASTHPTYRLGNAQHCRTNYTKKAVKRSEHVRVKVNGKWQIEVRSIRVVECVYRAPAIVVTGFINVLDGQLLTDGLAIGLNNLPPLPNVDAIPGDSVSLDGYVTEPTNPTPNGTMTFSVDGSLVSSCLDIPVQSDGVTPPKSTGECSYQFNSSGSFVVSVIFRGTDGSYASLSQTFTVASPDEVAIINNECLQLTFGHC